MKSIKFFVCIAFFIVLFCPVVSAIAADNPQKIVEDAVGQQLQKSAEKGAVTQIQKAVGTGVGQPTGTAAEPKVVCTPEHMRAMLTDDANRSCVVDGVLQDESATSMIMYRIASDPVKRKKMMEQCQMMEKVQSEKPGVTEQKSTLPGVGSIPKPESILPKK